jgi:hypothetical protein
LVTATVNADIQQLGTAEVLERKQSSQLQLACQPCVVLAAPAITVVTMPHSNCVVQHVLYSSHVACILVSPGQPLPRHCVDPLQELKKISAARNGEGSLLERFESTRTAVATTKADRGIREKLASEAANAPKPKPASTFASGSSSSSKSGGSFNLFGGSSSGPKPAAPKPLAPRPPPTPRPAVALAPKPAAAPAAPKAAAAAPKPAAAAAAGGAGAGFGGAVLGPVAQAVGVLGAVAVGANAVTGFATSNKKVRAQCFM